MIPKERIMRNPLNLFWTETEGDHLTQQLFGYEGIRWHREGRGFPDRSLSRSLECTIAPCTRGNDRRNPAVCL
jgi:hypothetical protein